MYMPEDDANVFAFFIHWLADDEIPDFKSQDYYPHIRPGADIYVRKLYKLFYLADKLGIKNELANKVMDRIQDIQLRFAKRPSAFDINAIYANTPEKSKLRGKFRELFSFYGPLFQGRNSVLFVFHSQITGADHLIVTVYAVLVMLRESAINNYPEFAARKNIPRSQQLDDDVGALKMLARASQDFSEDFIESQIRYGAYFRSLYTPHCAEPQSRERGRGFGRCFFHTHAESEVCHLGPPVVNDHFGP